ncbi:MAG TPA: hypothetical protein VGK54_08350 [Chloroflexota bacterium]
MYQASAVLPGAGNRLVYETMTEHAFDNYYDLESYLFTTVGPRFHQQGHLSALDFFSIVIWKANRAKSRIAANLLTSGHADLDSAVYELTQGIANEGTPKDRLRYVLQQWGFKLPITSALLTVLYPKDFTVYDMRVRGVLGFRQLENIRDFDNLWRGYEEFKQAVMEAVPERTTLRDADRYLWGKSFYQQLVADIERRFGG